MAKQIIILETNPADGGMNTIRAVFWFAVILAKRVPKAGNTTSKWSGADATETAALVDGSVVEEVRDLSFPTSFTTVELKAALQKAYADRAAFLGAQPFRLQYAGVWWDGTSWSA